MNIIISSGTLFNTFSQRSSFAKLYKKTISSSWNIIYHKKRSLKIESNIALQKDNQNSKQIKICI